MPKIRVDEKNDVKLEVPAKIVDYDDVTIDYVFAILIDRYLKRVFKKVKWLAEILGSALNGNKSTIGTYFVDYHLNSEYEDVLKYLTSALAQADVKGMAQGDIGFSEQSVYEFLYTTYIISFDLYIDGESSGRSYTYEATLKALESLEPSDIEKDNLTIDGVNKVVSSALKGTKSGVTESVYDGAYSSRIVSGIKDTLAIESQEICRTEFQTALEFFSYDSIGDLRNSGNSLYGKLADSLQDLYFYIQFPASKIVSELKKVSSWEEFNSLEVYVVINATYISEWDPKMTEYKSSDSIKFDSIREQYNTTLGNLTYGGVNEWSQSCSDIKDDYRVHTKIIQAINRFKELINVSTPDLSTSVDEPVSQDKPAGEVKEDSFDYSDEDSVVGDVVDVQDQGDDFGGSGETQLGKDQPDETQSDETQSDETQSDNGAEDAIAIRDRICGVFIKALTKDFTGKILSGYSPEEFSQEVKIDVSVTAGTDYSYKIGLEGVVFLDPDSSADLKDIDVFIVVDHETIISLLDTLEAEEHYSHEVVDLFDTYS